jgi:hypothetical protein
MKEPTVKAKNQMSVDEEFTVEAALKELRETFPNASFISVKTHAIYQRSIEHRPQADIQIEDQGCRRPTLAEAMSIVRAWKAQQAS